MRTLLASSIGLCAVTAATALLAPAAVSASPATTVAAAEDQLPGGTQSLPLNPLATDRAPGAGMGLKPRDVRPFSLVGVIWDDPAAHLQARAQVRTRERDSGDWTGWQDLHGHTEDAPDPGSAEGSGPGARGATAPLWVGESDAVQVRVLPGDPTDKARPALPKGLRVELVSPGAEPGDRAGGAGQAAVRAPGPAELPALSKAETEKMAGRPFIGPRPRITTRSGWGAKQLLIKKHLHYTSTVKAAFVHHTVTGNGYSCSQSPAVMRSIYRYHVKSQGWDDFGYNFAVDKCGRIFEGRSGGVTRAVQGAHTYGFNQNSMGVAVIGTYDSASVPKAAENAVARLTAWKLGLFGRNPAGKVTLTSGGGNKYPKGRKVTMSVISGHRDGFVTECPGGRLYARLGAARTSSAHLQGRR
ncbi:N-acetylmuramoyl-L-alanine amidase [Streptomyces sp. A7024]|uniref:N-acetylmuramoyl-L-alanine amidase n=1 Tax=Streptomyces coryli TaxID=1128680 RepID=A0A6G4U9M1_9ACTN|nr:N-acetylmuramoyl-L-alanine amidase [Streptomyces coryli]NGN68386.1 N-acetylmuramoyl-L-alanine amidase [Streptomyces coryli]